MFLENASEKGWIEVICGSMFSGKTEELIRRLRRAEFAHLRVENFKHRIAQFFDLRLVEVCRQRADAGVSVIIAGLDMDFAGKPFGPMPQLMATAEYVTKVHAICVRCGNLAHHSHRLSDDDKLVMLGEKDAYEPICRHCFAKLRH